MKTTHTPGPWRVETLVTNRGPIHQVLATINGYPSTVCTVEEYNEVPGFDANRLSDAQLLSAAPDLLKALKAALSVMEFYQKDSGMVGKISREAIAKAGGFIAKKRTSIASTKKSEAFFDALPDNSFVRVSQLVQSPKHPGAPVPLPFSAPTLWRKVRDGSFPKPVKLGAQITGFQVGAVRAWILDQSSKSKTGSAA